MDDGHRAHLGRLTHSPLVTTISLDGLDITAAAQLIDEVGCGHGSPPTGVAQTGGNPLFLRELAAWWSGWPVAPRGRRRSLQDPRRRRSSMWSTWPPSPATPSTPRCWLRRSIVAHDDVLDALERIEAAGIIGAGGPAGTFAFTHDVFRSGRYEDLTASRRMRLHAAVARGVGPIGSRGALTSRADVARHACLAGPRFDARRAADLARRAADVAARATDHGAAIEHYRRALDAMALDTDGRPPRPTRRHDRPRRVAGPHRRPRRLRRVPDRRPGSPPADDHVALAAALCAMAPGARRELSTTSCSTRSSRPLLARTMDALPRVGDARGGPACSPSSASTSSTSVDMDRGAAFLAEAVADAREIGDPITLGRALMSYRFCGGPLDSRPAAGVRSGAHRARRAHRPEIFTIVGLPAAVVVLPRAR